MRKSLVASVVLLSLWIGWASALEDIETCAAMAWDYEEGTEAGLFRIYLTQTSGSYPGYKPKSPKDGTPDAVAPAVPDLVLRIPCAAVAIRVTTPGVWYAVASAVNLEMTEESDLSNEISFTYRNSSTVPPTGPTLPPLVPPTPPILPPPPPAWPPLVPPVVTGPSLPGSSNLLSQQCQRLREQAPPPLPAVPPGGSLSDYRRCLAQGNCPR